MFDIGGGELVLIVLVFLLLFGPKKIPEVTRMLGKGMRKVKEAQAELKSQLDGIEKDVNITDNTSSKENISKK